MSYDLTRPATSSLNADYGIGRYYEGANTDGPYAFLRGGFWFNRENAGVAALFLNSAPGSQAYTLGSRCATDPVAILPSYLPSSGRSGSGGAQVAVGSIADAYFSQSVNLGDTSTYYFSAYVYNNTAGSVGGVVDATVASLYYGGNTITNPIYTAVVGETGWYLLTGTVTGVASSVDTGLVVKKGKTVIVDDVSLHQYSASGSLTSSIIDTEFASGSKWGTLTFNATTPTDTGVVVKLRTSNSPSMTGPPDFSTCSGLSSGSDISSNGCVTDSHRYFQYQAELETSDKLVTPTFQDLTLEFVTFDAVAPSIALTTLAPDPHSDNTPVLTGTASDVTGNVTAVEFQMNGTGGSWTACTADDSSFNSPTEAFTCTVTDALTDDMHTMNVRASDSNGNTTADGSVTSDTFTIDVTAPTVPGVPSTISPTADTTPTWSWTASSDATSGLATPAYTVEWSSSASFASGVFSATASSNSFTHITPLTDGSWYFRVKSSDLAGNQSAYSPTALVQINTGAPTGSVSINNGSEYTNNRSVNLSLTASSGFFTGTSDIQMKISNLPDLSDASYQAFASSLTWTLNAGDGSQTVYVQFKDSTGNESGAYTDTIVLDMTAPSGFDLQEPGHQSYTDNDRPAFKWRAASDPDATAGLSKYKLEIDNGESDDFTIDNINPSGTTTDETSQYRVEYQNFQDIDDTNNYILVTTKSSLLWGVENNDGRLKEGKREWRVVAVDRAGNETSHSRTLFVDRTGPRAEVTQINSVSCQANYSSASTRLVKNTQGDGSCAFSTSDTTPSIFGLVTDPLSGESDSDSQSARQNNRVASGPKQVEVRIEKLSGGGVYELHSLATVNLRENYWVHDGTIITDATRQDSDKFSSFEFAPQESLGRGSFRAKLYGRDVAGNSGGQVMVYFTIADFQSVATPEQVQIATEEIEEYIEQELPTATEEEKEQVREELLEQVEVTVPEEPVQISQTGALRAYLAEVRASLGQISQGLLVYIQQVGQQGWLALVESWQKPQQLAENLGQWWSYTQTAFSEMVLDTQPTMISQVKAEQVTPTTAVITWKTNHLATSKVNYGLTKDYGQDVQSSIKVHEHRVEITGLEPGVTYCYEVMSQNGNYVYDANHEFTTPVE